MPAKINVQLIGYLGNLVGTKEILVEVPDGAQVSALVSGFIACCKPDAVKMFYDSETASLKECLLVINNQIVKMPEGLQETVNPSDKVLILPLLTGG